MSRRPSPHTRLVLAALTPGRWRHGYDLVRETGVRSGTLYPMLIRLAERGLVEAEWQPPAEPGRPPRHAYRLTADGARLVAAWAQEDATIARGAPA